MGTAGTLSIQFVLPLMGKIFDQAEDPGGWRDREAFNAATARPPQ